jgi:hypothetical protein
MSHVIPIHGDKFDTSPTPIVNGGLLQRLTTLNLVAPVPREVEAYFENHDDLARLLEPIFIRLRSVFGQNAELSLEIYKDPEQHDQYPILYIRQSKYEAGILKQIESAVESFMTQLEDASGHLLVTTDFRRPRGSNVI